jgi:ATP-binding cassette subfamily B protein/subfamily B ATP-binding cassette protein MsbA
MPAREFKDQKTDHARSSRRRYKGFVRDYRAGQLDDATDARDAFRKSKELAEGTEETEATKKTGATEKKGTKGLLRGKRKQYLREYLRWLWPHRGAVAGLFTLALFGASMEMVEPLFMRYIIDNVILAPDIDRLVRLTNLNIAGALFVSLIVAGSLVRVIRDYRQRVLNAHVMLSLRRALFNHLLHLPLARLWDMKTGGILSRLTGDVDTTTGLLQMAVVSPLLSVIRLSIAMVLLFSINWRLALTALSIIPGVMAMSLVQSRRVRPVYRSVRKDAEVIDGRVGETFSGVRVVRAFRREARELLGYLVGRHAVLRKEMFAHRREMVIWASWGLLLGGVNVVIVWYGGYLVLEGLAKVGDIFAFQWYTFLLLNPVWNIVNSFSELQRSLAATERVFEVLAMETDKPDRPGATDAPTRVEQVEFQDVEFEYRPGTPVVRDFNVKVPGGAVVALVGRSGAGKTTVTDLVARFQDPTRGRILLNDIDIRDLKLATYRDLLALVQQDVFLFDGSVRDNIAYGRQNATDAEVEHAARLANAHEFIVELPQKYDTFVGERGVKLSGGQQQRLAIARAFLKGPQILILDEATSNLDTESEQLIQASMAKLLAGRTTFVIAHRLSTIRRANMILVMDAGRIVERGRHDELMKAGGMYYEMVKRQMEAHGDGDVI